MEKVREFALSADDIFEELVEKDGYRLNHVIIKPGKIFPTHPTDANITIIIVDGILTLKLEEQDPCHYNKGQIIEIAKGVSSELGNTSEARTEVFVIKS